MESSRAKKRSDRLHRRQWFREFCENCWGGRVVGDSEARTLHLCRERSGKKKPFFTLKLMIIDRYRFFLSRPKYWIKYQREYSNQGNKHHFHRYDVWLCKAFLHGKYMAVHNWKLFYCERMTCNATRFWVIRPFGDIWTFNS